MPPKPLPALPTHTFPTPASFTTFLSTHHATLPGLYLKFAKKTSGIRSITAPEAVECALCYGWIDGRANALDANYWTVRYTPRRAKSTWSQKNVDTVARLVEEGRMQPAGLATVDAAKKDGRWARAYAGSATIAVPADLEDALEGCEEAKRFFAGLGKTERYGILMKLQVASEKGRGKRIEGIVGLLAEGKITGSRAVKKELDEEEGLRIKPGAAKSKKSTGKRKAGEIEESEAPPRRAGLRQRT